jgi:Antitoxin Phd_YefM, type II toxin-antitoxin system
MTKWQLQEAKARFSELIDDTLEKGPQVVTRRGAGTSRTGRPHARVGHQQLVTAGGH